MDNKKTIYIHAMAMVRKLPTILLILVLKISLSPEEVLNLI